jgi:hypothetical protein
MSTSSEEDEDSSRNERMQRGALAPRLELAGFVGEDSSMSEGSKVENENEDEDVPIRRRFRDYHFIPPVGEVRDYNEYGQWVGTRWSLSWFEPRTVPDYAIYNFLFPENRLLHPISNTYPLIRKNFGLSEIVRNLNSNTDDATIGVLMSTLWRLAESQYPVEFTGCRDYSYYSDWRQHSVPIPNASVGAIPAEYEDYVDVDEDNFSTTRALVGDDEIMDSDQCKGEDKVEED